MSAEIPQLGRLTANHQLGLPGLDHGFQLADQRTDGGRRRAVTLQDDVDLVRRRVLELGVERDAVALLEVVFDFDLQQALRPLRAVQSAAHRIGNTNVQNLLDTTWVQTTVPTLMGFGTMGSNVVLGSYTGGSAGVFKCPGDRSTDRPSGLARVRSVAMNSAVGFNATGRRLGHGGGSFQLYPREMSIVSPSPGDLFVFTDEHPHSINDGSITICMGQGDPGHIIDTPGNFHGGGMFSFADGHVEAYRWNDLTLRLNIDYQPSTATLGNWNMLPADHAWLARHTSAP